MQPPTDKLLVSALCCSTASRRYSAPPTAETDRTELDNVRGLTESVDGRGRYTLI